jgi:hypothetical protein
MSKDRINQLTDELCSELSRDYILVRTDRPGAPHVIAIPASLAASVIAVTFSDNPSSFQNEAIERLATAGAKAELRTVSGMQRSHADVLAFEEECYKMGFVDSGSGRRTDNPHEKRSTDWYRFRANYDRGWNEGVALYHKLVKHAKPVNTPVAPPPPIEGEE